MLMCRALHYISLPKEGEVVSRKNTSCHYLVQFWHFGRRLTLIGQSLASFHYFRPSYVSIPVVVFSSVGTKGDIRQMVKAALLYIMRLDDLHQAPSKSCIFEIFCFISDLLKP